MGDGPAARHREAAARDAIDDALAGVCRDTDRDALVDRMIVAGVPAAPVVHPSTLATNPQFTARGFLEPVAHPVTGTQPLPGLPMRFSDLPRWYRAPAPTLGEHTAAVMREVLGLDDAAIETLRAERIIGERPVGL